MAVKVPSIAASRIFATDLYRRARHGGIGAKNTTITGLWPQYGMALLTFVEPLAGIGRHGFGFCVLALGAGQC